MKDSKICTVEMPMLTTLGGVKLNVDEYMREIIVSKGSNLPAKIEDVINVFEFTDFKAKAWKILADKMSKLEDQTELYQSAKRSAQQWSISSMYAYVKIGELSKDIEPEKNTRPMKTDSGLHKTRIVRDGKKGSLTHRQWKEAEQIEKNLDILEDVIETSKERDEVVTKTAVLGRIKAENRKNINEKATKKSNKKIANEKTTAVKDYYDVLKGFTAGIKSAIISAEHGDFSAEGKNFLVKKHNAITKLMEKLEELV
ncbi:MAG: hypothetical protein GY853_00535 [PVC group bacterium]|nr:hypothetical protein [PVC group bacterium]